MKRKMIIAGNWKMANEKKDMELFFDKIADEIKGVNDREIVVFPSFMYVPAAAEKAHSLNMEVGVQNFYPHENGAFTGEVSPSMIKDNGVDNVLIGHSERRHVLKETDAFIREKVSCAQKEGFKIFLCVGEKIEEREAGNHFKVVEDQITSALDDNFICEHEKMVIAYEPVWAIGTGKVATPAQAEEMHSHIRKFIEEKYDAADVRILYGGSVKPDNVKELMEQENIDGALIGGASLKADSFAKLVNWDK